MKYEYNEQRKVTMNGKKKENTNMKIVKDVMDML